MKYLSFNNFKMTHKIKKFKINVNVKLNIIIMSKFAN